MNGTHASLLHKMAVATAMLFEVYSMYRDQGLHSKKVPHQKCEEKRAMSLNPKP